MFALPQATEHLGDAQNNLEQWQGKVEEAEVEVAAASEAEAAARDEKDAAQALVDAVQLFLFAKGDGTLDFRPSRESPGMLEDKARPRRDQRLARRMPCAMCGSACCRFQRAHSLYQLPVLAPVRSGGGQVAPAGQVVRLILLS